MKRFLERLEADSTTTLMLRSERYRRRAERGGPRGPMLGYAHRALAAQALLRFHVEADPSGKGVELVQEALSEALVGLRSELGG